ncbi:MAG: methyltransferase domain-containing protein [Erysipelotrichales bacterium]|nr:methyltransferase domain-containing protein [Erysipelotrichales bacterium]
MKEVIVNLFNQNILTATSINTQFEFLKRHYRKVNANILVIGCSNGYKSLFFEKQSYNVTSIDSSKDNTILFKENVNKDCIISSYDSYIPDTALDIIWVDDAFTYESREDILNYLNHFATIIKPDGLIYCNFKFGNDYYVDGKLYTSFTLIDFSEFIKQSQFQMVDCLVTKDERPSRDEGWLHLLLRRK